MCDQKKEDDGLFLLWLYRFSGLLRAESFFFKPGKENEVTLSTKETLINCVDYLKDYQKMIGEYTETKYFCSINNETGCECSKILELKKRLLPRKIPQEPTVFLDLIKKEYDEKQEGLQNPVLNALWNHFFNPILKRLNDLVLECEGYFNTIIDWCNTYDDTGHSQYHHHVLCCEFREKCKGANSKIYRCLFHLRFSVLHINKGEEYFVYAQPECSKCGRYTCNDHYSSLGSGCKDLAHFCLHCCKGKNVGELFRNLFNKNDKRYKMPITMGCHSNEKFKYELLQ